MSLLYALLNCTGNNAAATATPSAFNKVALIGDSTIALYWCRTQSVSDIFFTASEIAAGKQAVNLAVPGQTIFGQQGVWTDDAQKATYDVIIVQIGLNDMFQNQSELVEAVIARYQTLINTINAGKKAGAKIMVSCMLPAKARWAGIPTDPVIAQAKWVALNSAIMNTYSTNITGVDYRNNLHVALLDDGAGNLAAAYNCGDGIHENAAGAIVIKDAMRTTLGI